MASDRYFLYYAYDTEELTLSKDVKTKINIYHILRRYEIIKKVWQNSLKQQQHKMSFKEAIRQSRIGEKHETVDATGR